MKTRLEEFDVQMKAIKEGINFVIPDDIIFFMTWQEIEMRATGEKSIDISKLKTITNYSVNYFFHSLNF